MTDVEAYMWIMKSGGPAVIGHAMHEADVDRFMASEWVMTASDGGIRSAHDYRCRLAGWGSTTAVCCESGCGRTS